ncbi:MAG TPA: adenylyltransferase/cytidyltransferase family protein [Aestuariivirgaceae bacterium]|jgi:glycerol-3-phosphate cytidylyltransferase
MQRSTRAGGRLVLTYGTFDLFHYGHVLLLKRARALGARLLVGVSTDEFNRQKGKTAYLRYAERCESVAACRYVDGVFPETCWEQKAEDIPRLAAQVFVMGSDWRGRFDDLRALCEVVYLPRTPVISSTLLRNAFAADPEGWRFGELAPAAS